MDHPPSKVVLAGEALAELPSEEALETAGKGYFYDARDLSIVVRAADAGEIDLAFDYDPAISEAAPDVLMDFQVTVPAGTPTDVPIHFASSANGWNHQPLAWLGPDSAGGQVLVPRGEYLFYKYTRGEWGSVEKWPGGVEASNRYELGKAHPGKKDTVFAWADLCP